MSLRPGLFRLKRAFEMEGTFRELMTKAEIGDVMILFDSNDESFQARCGSRHVRVRHLNSYVAVAAQTQTKGQHRLWLYRYSGELLFDLGVHAVSGIMPVAAQGILTWKTHHEGEVEDFAVLTADTLTLIRPNGSEEAAFIGNSWNAEADSLGNIYIESDKQFIRLHITEHDVERKEYLAYDPMFNEEHRPDYVVSGDSLWIHDLNSDFIRIGPDGVMATISASLMTKGVEQWYAQDEWLAILGKDKQTLQIFKDGVIHSAIAMPYDVESLVAIGPLGAVYGTNWDGQYSYFLITSDRRNILLTDYDEAYFCIMVPEGVIMPPRMRSEGCATLLVYK